MLNKFKLFDSDSLKLVHKRVFFSITIFIFVYFISIYRISDVMLFNENIDEKNIISQYIRGDIYDRNGNILATSIKSTSLSINPSKIKNKKKLSIKLSKILDLDSNQFEKKLLNDKKFIWIKRNITPNEYQEVINLGEINIKNHTEYKRIYPFKNASSHIVGHVDIDHSGQNGIERFYNDKLSKSEDIHLTLDINLQQLVRENLNKTINFYRADSGLAIVMNINNGNILSSVSLPDYNPEKKSSYKDNNLINRVFQSNFEMGSTFKPITATMGYDLGILSPDMTFDVTKKYFNISDFDNYKDDGIYDVEKIIVESSNIGTAKIATLIGKKNQKKFFSDIGFNNRINIENKEAANPLGNKNNWGPVETATIGFGHGFSITPLHLVKAYATLSNNGIEVFPTLKLNKNFKKKKILKNNKSSNFFLNLLNAVVLKTEYTGPRVKIEGYEIGGKTGTSELLNPAGGYYKDRNMTSFIGIFPINNPKFVVYTAIEYPKKADGTLQKMTGARVNAPLVREIIIDIINLFNIPKKINNEILKTDTNFFYKAINAFI
ncbi:MAG: hypothetical protein CBD97_03665 [Pelagibacteraceae bacterium TMED237]|nr:MAG: hypothetical protein CBD97_03665 [Pelagibacteraceae bacterium TMED237]